MVRFNPIKSSPLWNVSAEALWRRTPDKDLRLRYEDFVADPRASLERILELVGWPPSFPLLRRYGYCITPKG